MQDFLVVVDMQNDFVTGALGTKEAVSIVENVKRKIDSFNGTVIFTRDTHEMFYMDTQEGKYLPVPHCIEGTDGWQIYDGLPTEGAEFVNKPTFGYLDWAKYEFEEVELIGLCTDICVVSNALIIKAVYPEITVKVDATCCAGVTPESHEAALTTMKMCQINVIDS